MVRKSSDFVDLFRYNIFIVLFIHNNLDQIWLFTYFLLILEVALLEGWFISVRVLFFFISRAFYSGIYCWLFPLWFASLSNLGLVYEWFFCFVRYLFLSLFLATYFLIIWSFDLGFRSHSRHNNSTLIKSKLFRLQFWQLFLLSISTSFVGDKS